jgi:predicted nucleotidyltransferase
MDLGRPYADALPGARGMVLTTLVRLERPVTIRELARQAGVSGGRAAQVAAELARAGLVDASKAGRATLVGLNRDHLAADGITALVGIRGRLVQRLEAELRDWDGLEGAWLFGSAARGDGGPASDIDLLLVTGDSIDSDEWEEATARLADRVRRWTGNDVQLVEHTLDSFRRLVARGNPLVKAVRTDGIPLIALSESVVATVRGR